MLHNHKHEGWIVLCEECDEGRVYNNADPTSGQWVECDYCGGRGYREATEQEIDERDIVDERDLTHVYSANLIAQLAAIDAAFGVRP